MSTRRRIVTRILMSAAPLATSACGAGAPTPHARSGRAPDVVLITIDTLRAPTVWAATAMRLPNPHARRARETGCSLRGGGGASPAHGAVACFRADGAHAAGHGVRDNGRYVLPRAVRTLAEDFHQAGYRTAAFVSGFPLKRRFGFDRGFDSYDDHLPRGKDARRTAYVERTADRTTDAALAWLALVRARRRPLLPRVHYLRPARALRGTRRAMVGAASPYDGEIGFVDTQLGRLLRGARRAARGGAACSARDGRPRREPRRARRGHARHLRLRRHRSRAVLVAGPGVSRARGRRPSPARSTCRPTLLDYAGLAPRTTQGRSLRPRRWPATRRRAGLLRIAPSAASVRLGAAALRGATAKHKRSRRRASSSTTSCRMRPRRGPLGSGARGGSRRCGASSSARWRSTRRTPNRRWTRARENGSRRSATSARGGGSAPRAHGA